MSDVDILIENGTVITMDPQRRVLEASSVAVDKGKIVEIGAAANHAGPKFRQQGQDCVVQLALAMVTA